MNDYWYTVDQYGNVKKVVFANPKDAKKYEEVDDVWATKEDYEYDQYVTERIETKGY